MPSIAHSQEDHLRSRSSAASRSSWHPLEVENGSYDGGDEINIIIGGSGTASSVSSPPLVIPSTPEYRHLSRNNTDDDTISLLSDPEGAANNSPSRFSRRRGGRRTGRSGQPYQPLDMSLSQVATESKACFPVYGCASFLLSLLVAAIFVIPPPVTDQNEGEDFVQLACRQQVWKSFGYHIEESNYDEVSGLTTQTNRTNEKDWSWFLQRVNQMETTDRCQAQTETEATVPRYFCSCNNPTQPWDPDTAAGDDEASIEYTQLWESAFFHHRARIKNETTLPPFTDMELVLVGDSLTEHWMGSSIGRPKPVYAENAEVFQDLLRDNHEKRPYVHTTPFGISGDRCSQALYRIQNGAVIPSEPRLGVLTVFWVWIGTNDIIRDSCRPDQVAAGTLAIVRELRQRRPDAWVVVQSLLPSENAFPSVVNAVNQATKCLTDSTKKTFYYNSSNVFLMPSTNTVNTSRFVADGIHPNAEGSRVWARSMLDFLRNLYDERFYHR